MADKKKRPAPVVSSAFFPVECPIGEVAALQALARGDATKEQQIRALKWIVEQAGAAYEHSYCPNNPHDTTFNEGRRFVALSIITNLKINLQSLTKENQ